MMPLLPCCVEVKGGKGGGEGGGYLFFRLLCMYCLWVCPRTLMSASGLCAHVART
jgi:hypothetical protein